MLSLREPRNKDLYIAIEDVHLNIWLQLKGYQPRYMYENVYYYNSTNNIEDVIQLYKATKSESEVS